MRLLAALAGASIAACTCIDVSNIRPACDSGADCLGSERCCDGHCNTTCGGTAGGGAAGGTAGGTAGGDAGGSAGGKAGGGAAGGAVDAGCTPTSCPVGCCVGNGCKARDATACGPKADACMACPANRADSCDVDGGCACGAKPACAPGNRCAGGACQCEPASCAGCCIDVAGTGSPTCVPGGNETSCGSSPAACTPCPGGTRCIATRCQCTAAACDGGCCDSNGGCRTGIEDSACGIGGQQCSVCSGGMPICCPTGRCEPGVSASDCP